MRQGCKIIHLDNCTAILCGGESKDHICNEDAITFDTNEGERIFFSTSKEGQVWYDKNYKSVIGMSVTCSVCQRAVIDNALYLFDF